MTAAIRAAIVQALHAHDCKGRAQDPWPLTETPHLARQYEARADAVLAAIAPLLAALAVEHHARGYEERQIEAEQWGGAAPKPRRESDPDYSWDPNACPPLPFTGKACASPEPLPHRCCGACGVHTKASEATDG